MNQLASVQRFSSLPNTAQQLVQNNYPSLTLVYFAKYRSATWARLGPDSYRNGLVGKSFPRVRTKVFPSSPPNLTQALSPAIIVVVVLTHVSACQVRRRRPSSNFSLWFTFGPLHTWPYPSRLRQRRRPTEKMVLHVLNPYQLCLSQARFAERLYLHSHLGKGRTVILPPMCHVELNSIKILVLKNFWV